MYDLTSKLSDLPLYKKALDINILSRDICTYLSYDLESLDNNGIEHSGIYVTGDIVQQSTNLVPEIISAERERFSEKKYRHVERLNKLTARLYNNCKRLENTKSNGKDFIPILKKELKKFKALQKHWMLTL